MSVVIKTYIFYGTKVDLSKFDTSKFEDEDEFEDYLYDVINKPESAYKLIYDETTGNHQFGFVIDEACDSSWYPRYLSCQTFNQIMDQVTDEVRESIDWMLLIYFNERSELLPLEYKILTVCC